MSKGAKKKTMVDETAESREQIENESIEAEHEKEIVAEPVQEDVEILNRELDELKNKANEYLDGWQRSRAEFANYKKRVEREEALAYQNAAGNIFKRYLDVLDDLDRALKNRPENGDGADWAAGIELIYHKFLNILESEGVKIMHAEGEEFDPNLHEAISHEKVEGVPGGKIIEVVKQGYFLNDRVLRPAGVRVAK
jgi:molecular chaperone GrpE